MDTRKRLKCYQQTLDKVIQACCAHIDENSTNRHQLQGTQVHVPFILPAGILQYAHVPCDLH